MFAGTIRHDRNGWVRLARRFGTALCLLAVMLTLLGHVEPVSASALIDGYSLSTGDHATNTGPDHSSPATQQHCFNSGHCSLHAILPMASAECRRDVNILQSSPRRLAKGRAITPYHRPPSTTDIG